MFSANPSISPTGLKSLDLAKRKKNGVGRDWEQGRTEGLDRGRTRGSDWEVRLGYKRRDQLTWPYSLPLTMPRPPASN